MREKDYRELVLAEFDRQKTAGLLPPELLAPSRSGLRDHCVKVCTERYKKKDEPLLKSFYGERNSQAEYLIVVRKANAEKFRTMHNFLRRRKGTAFLNISMLAWMIDFEPRPYHDELEIPLIPELPGREPLSGPDKSPLPEPEIPLSDPVGGIPPPVFPTPGEAGSREIRKEEHICNEEETARPQPADRFDPNKLKKRWAYAVAATAVISVGLYFAITQQSASAGEGGCMVWSGEQYQQVNCNYKPQGNLAKVIPLDSGLLRHFQKIVHPEKLTGDDIGKVWCVKVDGRYEYYTDSGAHPVYPELHTRRLTHYIMNHNPVQEN